MNSYENYALDFEFDDELFPHLPLDWNEELSLEEYLERMQRCSEQINPSITI